MLVPFRSILVPAVLALPPGVGQDPALEAPVAPETPESPAPAVQEPAPSGYLAPDEVLEHLRSLREQGRMDWIRLAVTAEARELGVAAFGERALPGRPAILVVADPAGDRPAATAVALALCEALAEGGSPLLERATVYVAPLANPDAAARAFAGLAPRRGAAVDEDRDGLLDEDGPDDLDGDDLLLQMRVPDPTGDWRAAEADARALVRAQRDKGEAGAYRLLPEGRDDDRDRAYNEDDLGGADWDGNWPHRYRAHVPASGPYPLSEAETRALAEFVLGHPHLALVIVLGAEDNLSKPPEAGDDRSAKATKPLAEDAKLLALWSERWLKDAKNKPRSGERGAGGFAEWAYFQAGLPVVQSAVWSPPLDASASAGKDGEKEGDATEDGAGKKNDGAGKKDDKDVPDEVKLLRWNDQALGGAGFVPWRKFQHPDLGEVEIGGWKPLALHNPPAGELPALAEQWRARLESLAEDLPRLSWAKVEVRELGDGVLEARATLVNSGLLASMSEMGSVTNRPRPLRVLLELPEGGALLAGERIQSVERLGGSGGNREYRWLYALKPGSAPAQLRALSDTAGEALVVLEVNR
ncbi:MAG: hypothetical protein EYC70_13705 [Planctomycetota bacterium]|nr:MAG: hypothetical protein EYC70_13705 [Planctomycetota bacterium]